MIGLGFVRGRMLARRCGSRKADFDREAAFGSGTDLESRSVGFGDVGNDRQAETETIWAGGPVRGGALEGLEQTADLVCCYGRAGVGHRERRSRCCWLRP